MSNVAVAAILAATIPVGNAAGAFAHWALGWSRPQAEIAGIALSTTSLAVVYAVLVETGLNRTLVGKRLMSATFVTDFGTSAALSSHYVQHRTEQERLRVVAFAFPDSVLLPQGRDERLGRGAMGEPRRPRPAPRREDGAEACRCLARAGACRSGSARRERGMIVR